MICQRLFPNPICFSEIRLQIEIERDIILFFLFFWNIETKFGNSKLIWYYVEIYLKMWTFINKCFKAIQICFLKNKFYFICIHLSVSGYLLKKLASQGDLWCLILAQHSSCKGLASCLGSNHHFLLFFRLLSFLLVIQSLPRLFWQVRSSHFSLCFL